MVRDKEAIKLKPGSTLSIRVIGPFEKDLEILRDYWNDWLANPEERRQRREARGWLEDNEGADLPPGLGVSIDDETRPSQEVSPSPISPRSCCCWKNPSPAAASPASS